MLFLTGDFDRAMKICMDVKAELVQALLGIALGSMLAPMLLHSKRYIRNILET